MQQQTPNWDKRWDEVQQLKALLAQAEDRPLLEPWAFWVWSGLVALGTLINVGASHSSWTLHQSFMRVWLPIFIVGAVSESAAFVVRIKRSQQPWRARPFLKMMTGLVGFWTAGTVLIVALLNPVNPVPALILLFLSLSFFWLGSISFAGFYGEAALLLTAALVFLGLGWTSAPAYWTTGALCSLVLLTGGFHGRGSFTRVGADRSRRE